MFNSDDESAHLRRQQSRWNTAQSLRLYFGIGLLAVGVAVVVGILIQAKQILDGPDDSYLLRKIAAIDASQFTVTWTSGKVTLPPNALMIGAYVIAVLILLMAAGIAGTLIRTGSALLMSVARPKPDDETPASK